MKGGLLYNNPEYVNCRNCLLLFQNSPVVKGVKDAKLCSFSFCAMSTMLLLSQAFNDHSLCNGRSRWRHHCAFKFPMLHSDWLAWDACKRKEQPCVQII